MGALCSGGSGSSLQEDYKNKQIEKDQAKARKNEESKVKLLLLGAGESGKSTIFKQMKILYGKPYAEDEQRSFVPIVHVNLLQNFLLVVEYAKSKNITFNDVDSLKQFQDKYNEESPVDENVAKLVRSLWKDAVFQKCWEERSNYQVLECLSYFCAEENLSRLSKPGYLPDKMDILQARMRTSGIVEEKYVIDGVNFVIFDVGGQRNERKKWINCFDGVTSVLFVAAISEYDQVLFEDSRVKRSEETLKLFDEICNSPYFTNTTMILFLNKKDIFEDKLFKVPYKVPGVRNDDFDGPYANDPGVEPKDAIEAATKHTLNKFLALRKNKDKKVYHHVTCATDTKNVNVIFNACKDTILRDNLKSASFM